MEKRIMTDNELSDIFASYNPNLEPSEVFMSQLEQRMAQIDRELAARNEDLISRFKERNAKLRRLYLRALILTSVAGILVGIVITMLMPYLANATFLFTRTFGNISCTSQSLQNIHLIIWCGAALIIIFTYLTIYDLSLSIVKTKSTGLPTC